MRRRILLVLTLAASMIAVLAAAPGITPAVANGPDTPSRVLLIVIDGMRADYLDRYDLPNLEALRASGVGFSESQVGYMSSITVISHNVIASGQLPQHQGWSNEIFRDTENVLGGGGNSLYVMSSASCGDFSLLTKHEGYPKLADYLGELETDGDARFVSVATKDRSACGVGHPAEVSTPTAPSNDIIIGMARQSSGSESTCDGVKQRWRFPRGVNVPADIGQDCSRWFVDSLPDYGTLSTSPAWLYPLDGNRFVTGTDPTREGGDVWSTDAALEIMRDDFADADDDDWRGMFVGLAGPDKMAHMWGPNDAGAGPTHLPGALATVDAQVGVLLDELETEGILDETLIVVTADHGMTDADRFFGNPGVAGVTGQGDLNWYFGRETGTRADESYLSPSPAIAKLGERIGDNLAFSYQDTHVAVFLHDQARGERVAAAKKMRMLPGAIATYRLNGAGDAYVPVWTGPMTADERDWFDEHAQRLVNTMASPNNADAIALLANDVTYSVQGDHGGHQPDNQFIPIFFAGPGVAVGEISDEPIGNVDILPTILQHLGIEPTDDLDGEAFDLRNPA